MQHCGCGRNHLRDGKYAAISLFPPTPDCLRWLIETFILLYLKAAAASRVAVLIPQLWGPGEKLEADKTEIILSGSVSGTLQSCGKFQAQDRVNEIKRKRNIKLYVRGEATGTITWLRLMRKHHFQPPKGNKSFSETLCSEGDCITALLGTSKK